MVFEHPHNFPGQPIPMLDHFLSKEIFPDVQSKPPLMQLAAIASRPIAGYLGEETNIHLTTTTFQEVHAKLFPHAHGTGPRHCLRTVS